MTEKATQWKQAWLRACFYSVIAVSNLVVVQRLLFIAQK